jgi:beta-glucosidase
MNLRVSYVFAILTVFISLQLAAAQEVLPRPTQWGSEASREIRQSFPKEDPALRDLLGRMTWAEKCGQLTQYAGELTGPQPIKPELFDRISSGEIGSVLSVSEVARCRKMQDEAMKSRLKIPLLFAFDVIHGYRTVFPIPISEAASFDPELARGAARIAGTEAASAGINWTFAPMVDLARDPRWGRVIEGAGEDPYLGAVFARARVQGFQGETLGAADTLAACAKHLAGYGAAEGGRDYDTAEISEMTLRESYFPPFEAAMEAGVATVMPSFQETAGRPSTASTFLLKQVLRGEWDFPGLVVSDYGAIEELLQHRIAQTREQAGYLALKAGVDVDMMSDIFRTFPQTPESEAQVDKAVMKVLTLKKSLGLFDDPYRYLDEARERDTILKPEFRQAARAAAAKGAVLLENRKSVLPLDLKGVKTVAVIGPLADDTRSALGEWNLVGRVEDTISPLEGLRSGLKGRGVEVRFAQGCPAWKSDSSGIESAVTLAEESDLVILVVGEPYDVTGESRNRTRLGLPGSQMELLRRISQTGTTTVTVIANGRPLTLEEVSELSPTLLLLWHAGIEAGNGLVDVLLGEEPIGGKLPMTFPRSVGQIPLYYNRKTSGRPPVAGQEKYRVDYHDSPLTPLYPFGYGLTTSEFKLSRPAIVSPPSTWPLVIEGELSNVGDRVADEVPQLYLVDEVRSVTPPRRELKGFQRFTLKPGESVKYRFEVSKKDLSFIGLDLKRIFEAGWFQVAVGTSSDAEPTFRMNVEPAGWVAVSGL